MNILLTGGAGYLGTHTAVELLAAGHTVVIVDDLSNSSLEAVKRVEEISQASIDFHKIDLTTPGALTPVFESGRFDAVIHLAGLKSVGESVVEPLLYYRTNLSSSWNLCETMQQHGVLKLLFSSSATIYGNAVDVPLSEQSPVIDANSPYGRTKLMIERMLGDVATTGAMQVINLRYFNPAGAHVSGKIGEHPLGRPNNLLPFVSQFAAGMQEELVVYGNDYPTPDGTCIRDYIHVVDLAQGHLAALTAFERDEAVQVFNLGTGTGYSVLDVIQTFERVNGLTLPYRVGPRRQGDIAESYTDPTLASEQLNWRASRGLEEICRDAWRWQSSNPGGYQSS